MSGGEQRNRLEREATVVSMTERGEYLPTSIDGVHVFEPVIHEDSRGSFHEWFKADGFAEAVGYPFIPEQANMSVSAAGVVRGIHFADVPPGQAKMVTCAAGAVSDVIIDLRRGSDTYLQHIVVELNAETRKIVYLPVGVGHAFISHVDGSVVTYFTSTGYDPGIEHTLNIHDEALGIDVAAILGEVSEVTSDRDADAPGLSEVEHRLPEWSECQSLEREMKDLWAMSNEEDAGL